MKQCGIKQTIKLSTCAGVFLAGFFFSSFGFAEVDEIPPIASVKVFARHVSDKIMYHYLVKNNSEHSISSLTVGRYSQGNGNPANDVLELIELPTGWNIKYGIPSSSYNSPNGWRANLASYDTDVVNAENLPHAITWEPLNDRSPLIDAGQSSSRFSITLNKHDQNYLYGHALVVFSEGYPASISVPIEQLDITPPTLEVTLTPATLPPGNEKPVAVKASFQVKDDYDSMPQIKLESITSDQNSGTTDIFDAGIGLDDRYFKLSTDSKGEPGRIYSVYYSATDASGNQVLSLATVTVGEPDEQPATENSAPITVILTP